MVALPPRYRGIAADQRGYGGADPGVLIDATRGMGDFVDDALALMDHLGHDRFHLVGNSLGGLVVWWMMADTPGRLLSVTLAGPGSPFGFGGTRDAIGTPTTPDFAGSGGGLINPDLIRSLLDAGLEFDDAYRLATDVRDELADTAEISSDDIRQRMCHMLEDEGHLGAL